MTSAPRRSQKAARRPAAAKRKARGASAAARRPAAPAAVEKARRELDLSAEAVRAAAAALGQVADAIADEARDAERASLAGELAADQVLRDLLKLQRAFAAAPEGSLPAELEVLRKLPDAVLDFARRRLGVAPHLAVGQELEVPAGRLSAFLLDGTLPPADRGLVHVRVISPGWRRGSSVLVPPRAIII